MPETTYRQRIYERYASSFDSDGYDAGREPFYRLLTSQYMTSPSDVVLELGSGSGQLLAHLKSQGFEKVSGVDGSPEQVAIAAARGLHVQQGDALDALRAAVSDTLDVVVAIDLLEHFSKDEVFDLLDEVHRVLRPGGRLIVHTVNGDSPFFGSVRHGDFTHETTFTRNSIAQVLRTVGFADIHCYEDEPIVHGLKSAIRSVVWKIARSAVVVVLAAETGSLDWTRVLSQNFLTIATK